MHAQPDGLADGRGGAVGQGHEPGLDGAGAEQRGDEGGDAGAQGETFEGLVEGDGDEEDNERGAGADGEGHADEDAVEQDAGFEEEALEEEFLRVSRVLLFLGVVTVVLMCRGRFVEGDGFFGYWV